MSADSMAMSVPAPMAMPMSACVRGGCVIDAVPDHRHAVTVILETPNLLALFVG